MIKINYIIDLKEDHKEYDLKIHNQKKKLDNLIRFYNITKCKDVKVLERIRMMYCKLNEDIIIHRYLLKQIFNIETKIMHEQFKEMSKQLDVEF